MKLLSRIKATLFSVILAGSLAFTPGSLAFATQATPDADTSDAVDIEQASNEEWVVTFNGTDMESDFVYDLQQAVANLQPGDSELFKIKLVNACDEDVDWYVKNYIADSMEDDATNSLNASISGASYSYELRYYEEFQEGNDINIDAATEIIYSSENLGGEGATEDRAPKEPQAIEPAEPNTQSVEAAPVVGTGTNEAATGGLRNATSGNADDYVYLGRFPAGAVRMMTLSLGLDGETHTNAYFNTNAGVVIGYAAEPVGEGEEIVTTVDQVQRVPRQVGGDLPQTGDMLPTISIICLVLGLIMLACGLASWMNDRRKPAGGQQ